MKPTHAVVLIFALAGCPTPTSNNGPDGGGGGDAPPACSAQPGFETVEAVDAPDAPPGGYLDVSLELSQYDEPMLAYIGRSGGDDTGSQLYFTMWDRATCTWRTPTSIDTVGAVSTDYSANDSFPREVKLAQDGVSQRLAIAYQKQRVVGGDVFQDVMLAESTDLGMTWRTEVIAQPQMTDAADNTDQPSVAVSSGKTFVAYFQNYSPDPAARCSSGLCSVIRLSSRDGDSGTFDDIALPPADGNVTADDTVGPEVSIGLDLEPSVVFAEVTSDTGPGDYIAYYYGGTTQVAFTTNGRLNTVTGVDLVIDGETPYVAATATRTLTDDTNDVFFATSSAIAGTAWSTPAAMPSDGNKWMSGFVSIAQDDATHAVSIASDFYGGGGDGTSRCGGPNLSTSTTSGTSWSTCGVDPTGAYGFAGDYVTVKYARTGKRVAAYNYTTLNTALGDGLVVWRE